MLKTLTLILFPQLNPCHKTSARLALYIQFFGIECRIFNFYLSPISSIRKQLDKLEGGNLAASKIRNLECPSYEICLIDYGCGKFNRKIHIMEQYP